MTSRPPSNVIVARDPAELARTAAEWIASHVSEAVRRAGTCSVALSGGSTPKPVYEMLGSSTLAERFPWHEVDFYFADERSVPLDHPESTYRLVRETLLRDRPDVLDRVHRMPADAPDRGAAAARYGRQLPDPLDVLLLGMGEDGHTASLFPGSGALDEKDQRVVAVTGPKPPFERLTITPPVIEGARAVLVLVSGITKAQVLRRALGGEYDPKKVPAQLARRGTWIVDREAARDVLNV
jgi:6-phosphogluconolactonase